MVRRLAIVTSLLLLLVLSAYGAESPDYHIRQYDLTIVPNFAERSLEVKTIIKIRNAGLIDKFEFGLADEYPVQSVTVNGVAGEFTARNGVLTIRMAKPVNDVVITVATRGKAGQSHDETAPVMDNDSLFLLWSDRFYPIDYDHWAPVRTTITLPPDFKVIAPGHSVRSEEVGDAVRTVFETAQPTVCYSIFADRRWVRHERMVNGIKIVTLLHPAQDTFSEKIFQTSGDVLKFFTALHGYYPAEQFSFVTVAGMRGRRALNGYIAYGPPFLDREMEQTGYDAHETSLLWWGYAARGSGPGAFQWTEGFGDYVEFLYSYARKKPLPANFARFRREYMATPTEQEPPFEELRGNTPQKFVHGKLPWLMAVVHESIGDAAFRSAVQSLFVKYRNSTYTMDQFSAEFELASGTSLKWWREQWLERRGVPELSVAFTKQQGHRSATTMGMSSWSIQGTVTQNGNLYTIPLELGIRTAGGVEVIKVQVSKQTTEFQWSGRGEPLEVIVDPNEKLLLRTK